MSNDEKVALKEHIHAIRKIAVRKSVTEKDEADLRYLAAVLEEIILGT